MIAIESIDTASMRGKVMCGYQGWFRCPGDGTGMGWIHWSRNRNKITPDTITFEMWPDMSEYSDEEKYEAQGFTYPNGQPAYLFSSANKRTVLRHFEWMKQYGIDGIWLQRFLVDLEGGPLQERYPSTQIVLNNVQEASNHTGRIWALANRIIDFFKSDPQYGVFLVGGIMWTWYKESKWQEFSDRFDVICLWNVGNAVDEHGKRWANTGYWEEAKEKAEKAGMLYLPVVYPGFSWDNLMEKQPGTTLFPRENGIFYWKQFYRAAQLGIDTVYVAMFDEVDEGTAIFKVTNQPPIQSYFVTYDGYPSDWSINWRRRQDASR